MADPPRGMSRRPGAFDDPDDPDVVDDDDDAGQPGGAHGGGGYVYPVDDDDRDEPERPDRSWARVGVTLLSFILILVVALGIAWWAGVVWVRVLIHPPGASALCRDGAYSYAHSHSGACAGHHGVAAWIRLDDPAAGPPQSPAASE